MKYFEKTAMSKTYLHHFFDHSKIKGMLEAGGIIGRPNNLYFAYYKSYARKPLVSTTRLPKDTAYLKFPAGGRKPFLSFKMDKEKLKKNFKIKPFAHEKYTQKEKGISEFEELILPSKTKKFNKESVGIIPWNKVESVKIHDKNRLKKFMKEDPTLKDNIRKLHKEIKSKNK